MQFEEPILLYGAGKEAISSRAFLKQIAPDIKVYVTVDSGEANIPETTNIAPSDLTAAIDKRLFGTIIKSPGVSLYKPVFEHARAANINVTSNLNLWGLHYGGDRTIIAITGTKGKSTTATLVYGMLKQAGLDVGLAGNVGVPPLDIADKHAIVVLELSSYQTADIAFPASFIAVTNLYSEHVDWHGTARQYFADKLHLIAAAPKAKLGIGPQAATFDMMRPILGDARNVLPSLDDTLIDDMFEEAKTSALKGNHNFENAIVAATLAKTFDVEDEEIIAAIKKFRPLPHRLEEHTFGNTLFVDDSISTTPEATQAAVKTYTGHKIALLAGGYDREQDYNALGQTMFNSDVKLVVCLPTTGSRVAAAIEKHAPNISIVKASTIEEGMNIVAHRRANFDTVILSPGAPSYNQFKNFQERGTAFVKLAEQLFS